MIKKKYILPAVLSLMGMAASAQTSITFDTEDYAKISVYDQWSESPFRLGILTGNAGVADNPDKSVDKVLGIAPNPTNKVVAFQRSRHGGNAFGVRIDLKEPIRVTKQLQYIHVMAYLKDKPADSRMLVMGLGKRLESSWSWQTGEEEQFWAMTNAPVKPKEGWQDIVVNFKGFSYSKEENANSGIDIYSLIIVPDLRSPHADTSDWVAYLDEIVVDNNPEMRFSTERYMVDFNKEATPSRTDRSLMGVGLDEQGITGTEKFAYNDFVSKGIFSAKAGQKVQPTFNYKGVWMNAFVYADWGCDGAFTFDVNKDGTPAEGSEIVSFSGTEINKKWYNSNGTLLKDGNNIVNGVPAFTVPANVTPGFYRMRYKVDWNSLDPAGALTIAEDGGAVVDVTLDVHGDNVSVSASQLNGDIVLAKDNTPLQKYQTAYGQPLKVKVIPEKGFVQYGFQLKYGYHVNAPEQLDDNGNPNWILVKVPYSDISAEDGTYTIPAEYMRGAQVSIVGDMQQVQHYTVQVSGAPKGKGGAEFLGKTYGNKKVIDASQYFSAIDIKAVALEGFESQVSLDKKTKILTITYKKDY